MMTAKEVLATLTMDGKLITSLDYIVKLHGLTVSKEGGKTTFTLLASSSQGTLPEADRWLRLLEDET